MVVITDGFKRNHWRFAADGNSGFSACGLRAGVFQI